MFCKIKNRILESKMTIDEFLNEANECGYNLQFIKNILCIPNMMPPIGFHQELQKFLEDYSYKYGIVIKDIILTEDDSIIIYSKFVKHKKSKISTFVA